MEELQGEFPSAMISFLRRELGYSSPRVLLGLMNNFKCLRFSHCGRALRSCLSCLQGLALLSWLSGRMGTCQSVLSIALGQSFSSDDDHNGSDWCPCGGRDWT